MGVIEDIYRTRTVEDAAGNAYPLAHHIDQAEGQFLGEFIRSRPEIRKTLEVGCAYGLSSLIIAEAIRGRDGAHHTILEPLQSDYNGVGIANLKRAGVDFYELRDESSEIALPKLLSEGASFDLVFIDGWHSFDHTLLDLFYAIRLVRVGGFIIVDDTNMVSVGRAVEYVLGYPCITKVDGVPLNKSVKSRLFQMLPVVPKSLKERQFRSRHHSMAALQKTGEDKRHWSWISDGF